MVKFPLLVLVMALACSCAGSDQRTTLDRLELASGLTVLDEMSSNGGARVLVVDSGDEEIRNVADVLRSPSPQYRWVADPDPSTGLLGGVDVDGFPPGCFVFIEEISEEFSAKPGAYVDGADLVITSYCNI